MTNDYLRLLLRLEPLSGEGGCLLYGGGHVYVHALLDVRLQVGLLTKVGNPPRAGTTLGTVGITSLRKSPSFGAIASPSRHRWIDFRCEVLLGTVGQTPLEATNG